MTKAEALKDWKTEVHDYLSKIGIVSLRSLGRYLGVPQATTKKKGDLTACILSLLAGESKPAAKSNRGAPVKEDFVDPAILSRLEELNFKKASIEADSIEAGESSMPLGEEDIRAAVSLHAKNREIAYYDRAVFGGELITLAGSYCVKISEPRELLGEKAVISTKAVEESGARTGDKITFHAKTHMGYYMVAEILSVNALLSGTLLENFDRAPAEYPNEKLLPFEAGENVLLKYFVSLFPVGKGQRAMISGAPKSGKSTLLREVARAAAQNDAALKIVIALCEQSPEITNAWQREFQTADIYASGYYDDPEEQLEQAEKAMKRAKEYVCDGKSVLLLIDDLNALARAYNETDEASGGRVLNGDLESKTLHYMKRYLGAARKLKSGASLTVFGVLATNTGAPFDAALSQELLGVSSATWQLSGMFRRGRGARPDYAASHVDHENEFLTEEEQKTLDRLYITGAERIFEEGREERLKESRSAHEFLTRLLVK